MTEIENAVETIKQVSDLDVQLHLNISQYDLLIATEALKEKIEREKGCDYCNLIYSISTDYDIPEEMERRINNKYCPMCGKRLVGEE